MSIESYRNTAGYLRLQAHVEEAKQMPHESIDNFVFGRNEFGTLYFQNGAVTVGLCSGDQEPLIYAVEISPGNLGFTVTEVEIIGRLSRKKGCIIPKEADVRIHRNVPKYEAEDFLKTLDHYRKNEAVADSIRWNKLIFC